MAFFETLFSEVGQTVRGGQETVRSLFGDAVEGATTVATGAQQTSASIFGDLVDVPSETVAAGAEPLARVAEAGERTSGNLMNTALMAGAGVAAIGVADQVLNKGRGLKAIIGG